MVLLDAMNHPICAVVGWMNRSATIWIVFCKIDTGIPPGLVANRIPRTSI